MVLKKKKSSICESRYHLDRKIVNIFSFVVSIFLFNFLSFIIADMRSFTKRTNIYTKCEKDLQ